MHAPVPGTALWLVPLAAVGAAAVALAAPAKPPPPEEVELEVRGVVALDDDQASVIVLQEKGGKVLLPIFVGRAEGATIDGRLRRVATTRPQTHDLMERAIQELG